MDFTNATNPREYFYDCMRRNHTVQYCDQMLDKFFNSTAPIWTHWTDDKVIIILASVGFFLPALLCLLGLVSSISGIVLHIKHSHTQTSGSYLQLVVFVSDVWFLVIYCGQELVENGYVNLVFTHKWLRSSWDMEFYMRIPRSLLSGVEVFSVWLVVVITIDR